MMCAGGNWPVGDKGFCPGDSGGPLIVKGANWAQDVQIGSVSYTSGDCIGASECWQHTVMHCGACGAGRVPCQTASGDAMLSAGCPCCSCPQPSLLQLPSAVPVAAALSRPCCSWPMCAVAVRSHRCRCVCQHPVGVALDQQHGVCLDRQLPQRAVQAQDRQR